MKRIELGDNVTLVLLIAMSITFFLLLAVVAPDGTDTQSDPSHDQR
jgi:hypothetical protein